MKQNMNIGTIVNGPVNQNNDSLLEKYCYDPDGNLSDYTYCQTYGALYQWSEAVQRVAGTPERVQGICPSSWHVPTDAEQNTLDQYLNDPPNVCDANRFDYGCANAGTKLKTGGSSGFEGLLSGFRVAGGTFTGVGVQSEFWSSTESVYFFFRSLNSSEAGVYRQYTSDDYYGFALRCLHD